LSINLSCVCIYVLTIGSQCSLSSDGGFILRESMDKDPAPIEIPHDVLSQLTHWANELTLLMVFFHRGIHTKVRCLRARELSEKGFILFDEVTLAIHVIGLNKCLKLQFRKTDEIVSGEQREGRSVYLSDAEQLN
jgi:hypothetical protein